MLLLAITFSGCSLQKPIQSMKTITSSQPADDSTSINSTKNDPYWFKAYYDYISQNNFNPEAKLIDLDFDGTPEFLNCQYADGSQYYNIGASYKNGEVISFYVGEVSDFVGTYSKNDGSKLWYTRSFPFSLHRWSNTCMIFSSHNYSSLTDIIEDKLIEINFNDSSDDTNYSKLQVSISKGDEDVKLTSGEYSLYKNWYANADNRADTLIALPYIKELESNLNITPQKQVEIAFSKYCTDISKLKYEDFRKEMLKWHPGDLD